MRQKKLLVLAAGILQVAVIKKARELGYYVIAADGDKNAVGLQYADKAICANITDSYEMLEIAKSEGIDGVIHPCSEVSMSVMGIINDRLGLSGISEKTAVAATNKHLMRKAFDAYGAPSPKSFCYEWAEDAWLGFKSNFEGKAILKPSRNSGSRGIHRIDSNISREAFFREFEHSKSESRDNSVMVEQYIDGPEFSVEIIVWENTVNVLTVTDKKTTGSPNFVELGHSQPSIYSKEEVECIKNAAIKGVKALGINNCACHVEVKLQDDRSKAFNRKAYLMEVGARLGGDFISTVLTYLSTGIDMTAAAIKCAMGEEPDLASHSSHKGVCIRYFCPPPGRLMSITNREVLDNPKVYESEIYVREGDDIPEVTSSLSRSGHVIVLGETAVEAVEIADEIIQGVKFNTRE